MNTHQHTIHWHRPKARVVRPLNIKWDGIKQGARFLAVGIVNTAIDFAVLNALIYAFGLTREGALFLAFKTIAFIAAATNSFIMNKHWVFEDKTLGHGRKFRNQIYKFFSVSAVSMIVNAVISYSAFSISHQAFPEMSSQVIANISALAGTAAVFATNFFGYKLLVFKK